MAFLVKKRARLFPSFLKFAECGIVLAIVGTTLTMSAWALTLIYSADYALYIFRGSVRVVFWLPVMMYEEIAENSRQRELRALALRNGKHRPPIEIAIRVLEILHQDGDVDALIRMAQVCKALQLEAERFIYRHIEISERTLRKIATAFVARPARALLVRHIKIRLPNIVLLDRVREFQTLLYVIISRCTKLVELEVLGRAEEWFSFTLKGLVKPLPLRIYKSTCRLNEPFLMEVLESQPDITELWLDQEGPSISRDIALLAPPRPVGEDVLPQLTEVHGTAPQVASIVPGRPVWKVEINQHIPCIDRYERLAIWKAVASSSSAVTTLKIGVDIRIDGRFLKDVGAYLSEVQELEIRECGTEMYTVDDAISWSDGFATFPNLNSLTLDLPMGSSKFYTHESQEPIVKAWKNCKRLRRVVFIRRWGPHDEWEFDGKDWFYLNASARDYLFECY